MELWWPRAERLEWELRKLAEAGFDCEEPEEIPEAGPVELQVEFSHEGVGIPLRVVSPELYPYFRFLVFAETLDLDHHQHPHSKNLCLIGRATENWRPQDSLADYLVEQLPRVLETGRQADPEQARGLEEHQAEPFSDYYPYVRNAMYLIDGSWRIPADAVAGTIVFGTKGDTPFLQRAVVLKVADDEGTTLATMPQGVAGQYEHQLLGRWVRVSAPIQEFDPEAFFKAVRQADPDSVGWGNAPGGKQAIYGVLFPEESRWRDRSGRGWVFTTCMRARRTEEGGRKAKRPHDEYAFVRAGRAGKADLSIRTPELANLGKQTVSIFGLGCIGAPSALEFARAGIGVLRLLDYDYVDPATTVRWPLGLAVAGDDKAAVVKSLIESHYPHTSVEYSYVHQLGGGVETGTDLEVLGSMLDGTSLVYDATAELGVQRFLSAAARRLGLPYVAVSGTNGGWGGVVLRVRPGLTSGCWWCYQKHVEEDDLPEPPGDTSEFVQPEGCANPTFVGATFDLGTIALAGVRAAIEELSPDYPQTAWDLLVISLRKDTGEAGLPTFEGHAVERHPECPECHA